MLKTLWQLPRKVLDEDAFNSHICAKKTGKAHRNAIIHERFVSCVWNKYQREAAADSRDGLQIVVLCHKWPRKVENKRKERISDHQRLHTLCDISHIWISLRQHRGLLQSTDHIDYRACCCAVYRVPTKGKNYVSVQLTVRSSISRWIKYQKEFLLNGRKNKEISILKNHHQAETKLKFRYEFMDNHLSD